jgi:hypothetical protein
VNRKIIAVDFDGTCVEHSYPDVGKELPGCVVVLRQLVEAGHDLILWTMRCDSESAGPVLTDVVEWFKKNEIALFGINGNPDQDWSLSPKAYAHLYIDDAALGCPLITPSDGQRPFVDWVGVRAQLVELRFLTLNE